jgi:transcriptional regulator with GAF, ATPase, and Fis domain/tetratricopeptide (TPR) repeat protein
MLESARQALSRDPRAARAEAEQALVQARSGRNGVLTARALNLLAEASRIEGNRTRAQEQAFESLGLALSTGDRIEEQEALRLIRATETAAGEPDAGNGNQVAGNGVIKGVLADAYRSLGLTLAAGRDDRSRPVAPIRGAERRRFLEQALVYLEAGLSNQEPVADSWARVSSFHSLASIHRALGDWEKAIEYFCRALVDHERAGDRPGAAFCYNQIGETYLKRGRYERALESFETALAAADQGRSQRQRLVALGLQGDAYRFLGNNLRAESTYERYLTLAAELGSRDDEVRGLCRKAELLLAGQSPDMGGFANTPCSQKALELLAQALHVLYAPAGPQSQRSSSASSARAEEGNLQRVLANVWARTNQPTLAEAGYQAAIANLRQLDQDYELAQACADLGRFRAGQGDKAGALPQLQEAARLFRDLEAVNESCEVERCLFQLDTAQDRRLWLLRSLSSVATQLLPAAQSADRSLKLLKEALGFRDSAIYAAATGRFLGGRGPSTVSAEDARAICARGELIVTPRTLWLPLRLSGRAVGAAFMSWSEDTSLEWDKPFLEMLANLLAVALVREFDPAATGRDAKAGRPKSEAPCYAGIVGSSWALRKVYDLIERVAPTKTSVLIRGESGTGKELFARAIHQRSPRAAEALITVNCAAIPETLLESELFGIEKGTATGVAGRIGRFEQAASGTLFLDEIGDMSLPLQAKLLRVLQDRSLERVGGRSTIVVDTRVIAATNRDLEAAIREGRFRDDLYYRLNVMTILLPSLRERPEDLPILTDYFIERYNNEFDRRIRGVSAEAADVFRGYHWPGNVRELENVIERAVILCDSDLIQVQDLAPQLQPQAGPDAASHTMPDFSSVESLDRLRDARKQLQDEATSKVERDLLVKALKDNEWNISAAARQVRVSRAQFYRLLRKNGLRREE